MKENFASLIIITGLGLVISRLTVYDAPPVIIGLLLLLTAASAWVERSACDTEELGLLWSWKLRKKAGVGTPYCLFIPIADILSRYHVKGAVQIDRDVYLQMCTAQSVSFCICYILFFYLITSERPTQNINNANQQSTLSFYILMAGVVGCLLTAFFLPWLNLVECLIVSASTILSLVMLSRSFNAAPYNLSLAEAGIISQALSAFLLRVTCLILHNTLPNVLRHSQHLHSVPEVYAFMQVAVLCCFLDLAVLYLSPQGLQRSSIAYYVLVPGTILFVSVPLLVFLLRQDWVSWLITYIQQTVTKKSLFFYWAACLLGAVVLVIHHARTLIPQSHHAMQSSSGSKDSDAPLTNNKPVITSSMRKHFHLLAMCVIIPGLVTDVEITCLALTCAFVVFLMLESMRLCEIIPFGPHLEAYLRVFVDEKDEGPLLLTPVYLLVGCALPLWLFPTDRGPHICLYSGLLSLGVGDTAASVIGSKFGQWKWFHSRKTVEGTLASIVCQFVFLQFLISYGLCVDVRWLSVMAAIILTSLLEAFTSQIDNLVLPFFMYILILSL